MCRRKVIIGFLLVLLAGNASAIYVGTAPGVQDLGVIERGETRTVNFYLVTNINGPFQVRPSFTRPSTAVYRGNKTGRYEFIPAQSSQEDISGWVRFQRDRFTVDPSTERVIGLQNGGVTRAQGEVTFFLEVPEDAEPGYHAGAVNLNPRLGGRGGSGTGVVTMGVTQFVFVFRVPGTAKRKLDIERVNALRTGDKQARIDFLVRNEGTVTTRVARAETLLYDDFGNKSGELATGGMYLKPGETKVVSTYWRGGHVKAGDYRVRGELNYLTGNAFLDETISITDYIQIQSADEEGEGGIPWWMVVIVLVLLGVLMLYLDIDPIWILAALGVLGISAFILMSNLPLYLIGVLIILTAGVLVYRWY